MPKEREIVARIRGLLGADGAKLIKTSGEGEPDLIGSYRGFAVAIECKQPGERPTPLQMRRLNEWERAGAIAFWTDFPPKALQLVQQGYEKRITDLSRTTVFVEYEPPPDTVKLEFMDGRPPIYVPAGPETEEDPCE